MDDEPVTARSIGYTYMVNSATFAKRYKDTLSGYETWDQKDHAEDWILLPQNAGTEFGIDETSLQGELYTIVHNKEGHGGKGSVVAVVKGTNVSDVAEVLNRLPKEKRDLAKSVTMDLSDSMRAIVKSVFPDAIVIRDCFHVVRRGGEACEEMRLRLKREAVKMLKKEKSEFHRKLEKLAARRKAYRESMKKKHGEKWRKCKRGRKPQKVSARFVPTKLSNGETLVEALTRCSKQLTMSRDKWSKTQEARAKIIFEKYPKLKETYNLINSLRAIFRNKSLTKETARLKFKEWYDEVASCTIREVKSVRDSIKFYEDEILNYFISWQTNASAESLNSKIKCFRTQVKGVNDIPFFMYRIATVLG